MAQAPLVRTADDQDIPAIAEIYAHHVLHGLASFELDAPDAREMARRRAHRWVDSVLMQRALGAGDGAPPAEPR